MSFSSQEMGVRCEIEIENRVYEHFEMVNSVCYFPKHRKLVSCSCDKVINIWEYTSYDFTPRLEKSIKAHNDWIREVIVWDDDKYLSCCDDRSVRSFSINPPYEQLEEFRFNKGYVIQILKLNDDLFMSVDLGKEKPFIISYSKNELVRELKKESLHVEYTRTVLSNKFSDCFYINTWDEKKSVKLIDFNKNETIKSLYLHHNDPIYTISVLPSTSMTKKNDGKEDYEEVLCAGLHGVLYLYKVFTSSEISVSFPKKFNVSKNPINTSLCITSNLILFGNPDGTLFAVSGGNVLGKSQVHNKNITKIQMLSHIYNEDFGDNNEMIVSLVTSSADSSIKVINCRFTQLQSKKMVKNRMIDTFKSHVLDTLEGRALSKVMTKTEINEFIQNTTETFKREYIEEIGGEKSPSYLLFKPLVDRQASNFLVSDWKKDQVYFGNCFYPTTVLRSSLTDSSKPSSSSSKKNKPRNPIYHGFGVLIQKRKKKRLSLISETHYTPIYCGDFKDGKFDGRGQLFDLKSGILLYEGEVRKSKKHGIGVEIVIQGHQSKSSKFSTSRFEGRGEFYDGKTGEVVKGVWNHGELDEDSVTKFSCPFIRYSEVEKYLKSGSMIGSGGFAVVFRVKSSIPPFRGLLPESYGKSFVAVKIIKSRTSSNKRMLAKMIRRGIELCLSLKNENILEVFGVIEGFSEIGIIMPICRMSVTNTIVQASKGMEIGMDEKIRILHGTSKGIRALHASSVMHRDLKWDNVLLDDHGIVKITDFDTLKEDARWRIRTLTGSSKIGTPGFLSPEVFMGRRYSLGCDVFSFGLMLYSLLWEVRYPYDLLIKSGGGCSCGTEVSSLFSNKNLDYHVAYCNLRPEVKEEDYTRFPAFLLDLMVQCWDKNHMNRPSFEDIVQVFGNKKRRKRCFTIISLVFPDHEELKNSQSIMLLVVAKVKKIKEWIEEKFEGSKVVRLMDDENGKSIKNDKDVQKLIEKSKKPVIQVELDKIIDKYHRSSNNNDSSSAKSLTQEDVEKLKRRIKEMEEEHETNLREMGESYERRIREMEIKNEKTNKINKKLEKMMLEFRKIIIDNNIPFDDIQRRQEEIEDTSMNNNEEGRRNEEEDEGEEEEKIQ